MKTSGEIPIAYDDIGDGATALLGLPGWCAPRSAFRPMYAALGEAHRVLAVDWRGHGGSGATDADFGAEDLVADALAVIEAAGVSRVVPVATAHAGWLAIELRRRLGPAKVPGIVLIDWMVTGAPPGFLAGLAALQDPARWSGARAGLFERWTTGVASAEVHAFVEKMGEYGFAMWSRAAREIGAAFQAHPNPLAVLEGLSPACPTLHLYAQPDDPGFLAAQQDFAASHPWFRVEKVDARSHFPTIEAPGPVAAAIAAFVRGLP